MNSGEAMLEPKRDMAPAGPNRASRKINGNQWLYLVLLVNWLPFRTMFKILY